MPWFLDAAAGSDDTISAATRGLPNFPCPRRAVQHSVFSDDQWTRAANANASPAAWALPRSGVGAANCCGTRRSDKGADRSHHPGGSAFNTTSATTAAAGIGSSEDFRWVGWICVLLKHLYLCYMQRLFVHGKRQGHSLPIVIITWRFYFPRSCDN